MREFNNYVSAGGEGGGVQIDEKNTYVILERHLWIVELAMLILF